MTFADSGSAHEGGSLKLTGIEGLDDILAGGFANGRLFLLEGSPGTGKTTIAMQFLLQGMQAGDKCLYISLSETEEELRESAASHGWDLSDIALFELVPPESLLDEQQQQSLLYSSDLELGEATKRIFSVFEQEQPDRVVLDSLSEIRLLAQSSLRYRRQILALKHYFSKRGTTVLMLDDLTADALDNTVHSIAHGVVRLEELSPGYGSERRRLKVLKYRGRKFRGGFHDFVIDTGGVRVFPAGVGRAPWKFPADFAVQRQSGIRRLAWRRNPTRVQHPNPRARRHRQVPADTNLRHGGHRPWRTRGHVRVRRGAGPAV